MSCKGWCRVVFTFLVVGWALPGPAVAQEAEGTEQERRVDRRVVIIKAEDGEELVHSALGDHSFRFPLLGGGFLGVELTQLSPELRVHFGVPEEAGVMVGRVLEESPAARAGVEVGDIITAADEVAVDSPQALARAIHEAEDGATVELELWRDGQVQTLPAVVERRKPLHPARALFLRCGEDEEDCTARLDRDLDLDCGEEDCEVTVECHAGDCACEVNGESRDCREIDGLDLQDD